MSMSDKEMMKWLKEDGERLDKIRKEKSILSNRKVLFEVFRHWDMDEGLKTLCVDKFINMMGGSISFRIYQAGDNTEYITIYENYDLIEKIWDVTDLYEFFKKWK